MQPRQITSALGSALFLLVAPGTVAGLAPYWISRWQALPPFFGWAALPILGAMLGIAGVCVLVESFARFAWVGLGTPAPVAPTRHLVVTCLYRYVRNPMYVAVVSLIVGQGLFFGNAGVLEYGVFVWLAFHLFVPFYEEPRRAEGPPLEFGLYATGSSGKRTS